MRQQYVILTKTSYPNIRFLFSLWDRSEIKQGFFQFKWSGCKCISIPIVNVMSYSKKIARAGQQ